MTSYEELEKIFTRAVHLQGIRMFLFWDSKTMMPPGGAATRADHLATVMSCRHDILCDRRVGELLDEAEGRTGGLDEWQAANLREMRRLWVHENALSDELASDLARASAEATVEWVKAKAAADFSLFAPSLEHMIDLQRQSAAARAAALGCSPHDAIMDQYDPGASTAELDRVFGELEAFLPDFIVEVRRSRAAAGDPLPITESVPIDKQERLLREVAERIGLTQEGLRIDHTEHPFAVAYMPGDARFTAHFAEDNFKFCLMGGFHEAGHELYEMNLPWEWRSQPVGLASSASTHESQSIGMERMAGQSPEFLSWLAPRIRKVFGVTGPEWTDENLTATFRRVQPGYIRIHADEVCYPLHVIIRYRIEQAILDGSLDVGDIPGSWNDAYERLLGIRPRNDAEGCLQDVHWSIGMLGYFPSYAIGELKAAQFFDAACRADSSILPALAEGDFSPWSDWLREHVHRKGSLFPAPELLERATGSALDVTIFERHLEKRYL